MSLLLRRRALLGQVDKQGWDGRDCVAVGSNGYLYYSTDYGVNWSRWSSWTGIQHAYIARSSSVAANIGSPVYFVGGSNIFFTRIGSNSYIYTGIGAQGQNVCCNGEGTIAFTSYNAGSSWQTGYQTYIRKVTRSNETSLGITTKGTFSTWDQAAGGKAACSVDGKYAVIGGAAGFTNGFQTTNYGESWAECLATQSFGNGMRDIDCSVTGECFISNINGAYIVQSDNYLSSWYIGTSNVVSMKGTTVAKPAGLKSNNKIICRGSKAYSSGNTQELVIELTVDGVLTSYSKYLSPFSTIRSNAKGDKLIALTSVAASNVWYSHDFGRNWYQSNGLPVAMTEISMVKYA